MLGSLFNLIYPRICHACGNSLNENVKGVCFDCRSDMARLNIIDFKNNPIHKAFWGRLELNKATSYLKFEKNGKTQQLLHALKYQNKKDIGILLGELAYVDLRSTSFFHDIDLLAPVPIHKIKERKRGYNQSQLIAEGISSISKIPVDTHSLVKEINTSSQTRKTRFERFQNANNSFRVIQPDSFVNKHVLLVDDVITTGATIEACGNILRNIKGIQLSLLTIASTY